MRWNIFDRFGRKEKFYLTKKGLEKLKKEQETLKKLKLAKIKGEAPRVLHSDELDPEYLSFKEDLDFLELRLSRIEEILKNTELIKIPSREEQDKVYLGAKVIVEVDEQTDEFLIVGTLEADPALGKISNESPVGKALLGHKVGEEVIITSPIKVIYKIKDIKYKD